MIDKLTSEDFSKHAKKKAVIHLPEGGSVEAEICEVVGVGTEREHAKGRQQAFSVLFRGPEDAALVQQIYKVDLPEIGELELFLVTVGPDPDTGGMCYEAVFY